MIIDTSRQPLLELVHVQCPVCGSTATASLYMNCITPPGGATLEEALTTACDHVAHQALAVHLLDRGCQWASMGEPCTLGTLFGDRSTQDVFWLVRKINADEAADGDPHYRVECYTGAEISAELEKAKAEHRRLHRLLKQAADDILQLRSLAQASDKIECPF